MWVSSSLIASFNEAYEANEMEESGVCGYGECAEGDGIEEVSSDFSEQAFREK